MASSSEGTGTVIKSPVYIFSLSNYAWITSAAYLSFSTTPEFLYPLSDTKKAGKFVYLNPKTGTPWVSKYSKVLGISKIDFAPAETTATYVLPNSLKSADMSKVFSAPLCTPPIPPVTKIFIPAYWAHIIVAATVVEPLIFLTNANAKSLLEHF